MVAFNITFISKFLIGIFDTKFSKQPIGISKIDHKHLVNDIIQKAALCIIIQYLINSIRET